MHGWCQESAEVFPEEKWGLVPETSMIIQARLKSESSATSNWHTRRDAKYPRVCPSLHLNRFPYACCAEELSIQVDNAEKTTQRDLSSCSWFLVLAIRGMQHLPSLLG